MAIVYMAIIYMVIIYMAIIFMVIIYMVIIYDKQRDAIISNFYIIIHDIISSRHLSFILTT
jgi:hypothetical protein